MWTSVANGIISLTDSKYRVNSLVFLYSSLPSNIWKTTWIITVLSVFCLKYRMVSISSILYCLKYYSHFLSSFVADLQVSYFWCEYFFFWSPHGSLQCHCWDVIFRHSKIARRIAEISSIGSFLGVNRPLVLFLLFSAALFEVCIKINFLTFSNCKTLLHKVLTDSSQTSEVRLDANAWYSITWIGIPMSWSPFWILSWMKLLPLLNNSTSGFLRSLSY